MHDRFERMIEDRLQRIQASIESGRLHSRDTLQQRLGRVKSECSRVARAYTFEVEGDGEAGSRDPPDRPPAREPREGPRSRCLLAYVLYRTLDRIAKEKSLGMTAHKVRIAVAGKAKERSRTSSTSLTRHRSRSCGPRRRTQSWPASLASPSGPSTRRRSISLQTSVTGH
jgi:hypothetical protein